MRETAIGLMAKFPQLGKVKTRLAVEIGDEKALIVYNALLADSINMLQGLNGDLFLRSVFATPDDSFERFQESYSGCDAYFRQEGDDLGQRMKHALETLLNLPGIEKAFLIGVDIPGVSQEGLLQGSRLLSRNDIVLGPTQDGGYYTIGVHKIDPDLFSLPEWSTEHVFDQSVQIIEANGLHLGLLEAKRDLDTIDDLRFFHEYHALVK